MKKLTHQFGIAWRMAAMLALGCLTQTAKAGWTGAMNGVGIGWASVNVSASNVITGIITSNLVNCPSNHAPSASIVATAGYIAGGPLPDGASPSTLALIKGTNGYKWTAKTVPFNGDKTDNAKLDSLVKVDPADCASLDMDSSADIAPDGKSGVLHVNTKATPGTALLLRGYEYKDPTPPTTVDELETNRNSFLKWQTLMVGPFDLNSSNCNGVSIPFTIDTSISNLYFVVDGEAKSLPLVLYCPTNVIVHCGETVTYPPAYYSACGDVDVSYNPPQNSSFPIGVTPVTITIQDHYGDSTNCTFTVTLVDDSTPVVPILADITGQCSAQVPTPTTVSVCGTITNPVVGMTTDPTSYNTQGTHVVHWTFNNGNGNISVATQNVIVKDTMPPLKPTLADLNYGTCSTLSVTPPTPTTTDNCAGVVTGMTTTTFPITALGTTVVTWTFDDGNGNTTTTTQNVTLGGLTFSGFYSPIGGTGGTCATPLQTVNRGSVIPIKFDISCGSTLITSGQPPLVKIQPYSNNCVPGADLVDVNAVYQNNWHFNWDTTGWKQGTYKVVVVLPDGSSQFVFVKLK